MKFLILLCLFFPLSVLAIDSNIRDTDTIQVTGASNDMVDTFVGPIRDFFFAPSGSSNAVENTFFNIANGVKNFFVAIAVIFLIIAILKLLFSGGEEEKVKKWKRNIIWVTIGIFVMQIAFPVWRTLFLKDSAFSGPFIDPRLGWLIWINILEPIVGLLLLLASLGFLAMGVYAFYTMITAGGDEERVKKGKNIIIYAIVGFLLIRVPRALVPAIYGTPTDACRDTSWFSIGSCIVSNRNLSESINIFGKILLYISGFLGILAVALVIYAGWIVLTSAGEEEKLKKAKNIVLYIAVGFILLVASHAIFRFFFLRG